MKGISTQIDLTNSNPMQLGATAPKFGNRRGMRDAHLARSCVGGLKLRFARRYMAAQGLRPSPTDWEGCFAAWENWEWGVKKFSCLSQAPWKFWAPSFPKISQSAGGGFPIRRGTAKGRATGPTTHEARFNVASATAQTREARPRQFPCLGAVAPKSAGLAWKESGILPFAHLLPLHALHVLHGSSYLNWISRTSVRAGD